MAIVKSRSEYKIKKLAFYDELTGERNSVKFIIDSKDLNLVVVGEGVEKLEQAMFLNKIGCNIAQGYLYSKPMPINIFEEKELKKVKIISN